MHTPLIMVSPTGARRGKEDHPSLPTTTSEIVETAADCHRAGADALHLHVRDDTGAHSLDAGRYRETLAELARAVPEMRVQITTEAFGTYSVAQQLACVEQVAPDWVSISVREMARDSRPRTRAFTQLPPISDAEVQHILYDAEDVALLQRWQAEGIVHADQTSCLFVLGHYSSGLISSPADLGKFLTLFPERPEWMLCAFGPQEHACLTYAAAHGGNIRVGFENSLVDASGTPHHDNAASVATLVQGLHRQAA